MPAVPKRRRYEGPFLELFRTVIEAKAKADQRYLSKSLAAELGIEYDLLRRWIRGDRPVPASAIPAICKLLDDYRLLDFLETELDRRVAYLPRPVPELASASMEKLVVEDIKAIKELMKEVAEALGELADTLKDHKVTESECRKTSAQLDDVIRECERLKQWLKARVAPKKSGS